MPDRPGGLPTTLTNVLFPRNTNAPQSVYQYAPLLEFEARSTPPVSGAAVLNLGGELVGLTSTVAAVSGGDNGRAYALPMDANMRRVVETLARGMEVEYGFLGIMLNQDQTGAGPVVVSSVAPRSPSEGRLFPGDMVVRINDQPTRNYADLLYQVGYTLAGNRLTLVARRTDGKERPVEVTVAKYKHDFPFIAANRPEPVFGLRVDWGSVFAQGGGGGVAPVVPPGVAVREVVPGSPAAEKFKELGDNVRWLVTHVNGTPTPTPAAFYQATRNQPTVRLSLVDTGDTNARRRDVALP
jgi:serine protease Do